MSKEIERKFLVTSCTFQELAHPLFYHQGYLSVEKERTVRVRIQGDEAKLTIKGKNQGIVRDEFEYSIPIEDARYLLTNLCLQPTIQKYRYKIPYEGFIWEVDVFGGENEGLILAEIELPDEKTSFQKPDWIGQEVTSDSRYYNSALILHPYQQWDTY